MTDILLALLLGASALRRLLWWATVVLPLAAWLTCGTGGGGCAARG